MPFAPARTTVTTKPRQAKALLAGTVLLAVASAAFGQERAPAAVGAPGAGELRTTDRLDLAAELRGRERPSSAAPYSAARDQTLYEEPFADPSDAPVSAEDPGTQASEDDPATANDVGDANAVAAPSRPRFDLFEEAPSSARASRAGPATEPLRPQDRRQRQQGERTAAGRERGAGNVEAAAQAAPLRGAQDLPASGAGRRGGPLDNRPTLAAAPVRSSRTLDGRIGLGSPALRGTFPLAPDDPFAPVGTRLGSFVLFAALDQSVGYSSNLDRRQGGAEGAFSDTTLSARLASDWSRHAAELNALADYRRNFAGELPSDPDVSVDGRLRLDIDRLTTANLRGGFIFRRETGENLDAPLPGGEQPTLLNYSTSADIERAFGEAFARGTVAAVRETTDRRKAPGVPGENYNTYTGSLRAGYRLSPLLAPFVEGSGGRRLFDEGAGVAGLERDSTIAALRGGLLFDFSEKLTGEIALGNAWNLPDADSVGAVSAPTVDARVAWSPQRGTDLALTAATTFAPDTVDAGTSTLYQIGLAARHRATARLDLNAAATLGYRDGQNAVDTERTWGASAGFNYWLNRSLALIGVASHDDVNRLNGPGDYAVNSVKLGIRLQN